MKTEKKNNRKLLFLDVLVCNKPNLVTSVWRAIAANQKDKNNKNKKKNKMKNKTKKIEKIKKYIIQKKTHKIIMAHECEI